VELHGVEQCPGVQAHVVEAYELLGPKRVDGAQIGEHRVEGVIGRRPGQHLDGDLLVVDPQAARGPGQVDPAVRTAAELAQERVVTHTLHGHLLSPSGSRAGVADGPLAVALEQQLALAEPYPVAGE
jgi:hypothetical protein